MILYRVCPYDKEKNIEEGRTDIRLNSTYRVAALLNKTKKILPNKLREVKREKISFAIIFKNKISCFA